MRHVVKQYQRCTLLFASLLVLGCAPGEPPATTHAERAAMVREHFARQVAERPTVATTVTDAGQTIDWIPLGSQVPGGDVAEAPPPAALPAVEEGAGGVPTEEGVELVDRGAGAGLAPHERGPEGTVPVVRFDVEAYLARTPDLPATMADFTPWPVPAPGANDRYYTHLFRETEGNDGAYAFLNVWDNWGAFSGDTSIRQVSVSAGNVCGPLGCVPNQTIESGLIEYGPESHRVTLDAADPTVFVYYTLDGYQTRGHFAGGYNALVAGWVQRSPVMAPGLSVPQDLSVPNGTQVAARVDVRLFRGNWWVGFDGIFMGYYPASIFAEVDGLRNQGERVTWYGEVFDSFAPDPSPTGMGSGRHAEERFGRAAYVRDPVRYMDGDTGLGAWSCVEDTRPATDPDCYSKLPMIGPVSGRSSFRCYTYYGGPGAWDGSCN